MHLDHFTPAPIISPAQSFETLREVTATVGKRLRVPSTSRQVMRAATLHCQKGGHVRTGAECLDCQRIVSIKPSPGRTQVTVRCLWTEMDMVEAVMTRSSTLVTVRDSVCRGRADQLAAEHRIHHLVVVGDSGGVVGTVCRCRLAEPGSPAGQYAVADFMHQDIWTITAATSLGEAAEAMDRLGVDILMVADGSELLGIVTKRDLGLVDESHLQ